MIATPSLTFSEATNKATNDIFKISGRSRRSEFWWTMGVVYLVNVFLTPFIGTILSLLAIPLKIRRLHDVGKSGWWWGWGFIIKYLALWVFILIYKLILFIFYCMDSEPYANKYGDSPKYVMKPL